MNLKTNKLIFLAWFIISSLSISAQVPKDSLINKGKPIIQVFGNFDYNATQEVQKIWILVWPRSLWV